MTMNIYNRECAALILIALFLFLSAYYYHQQAEMHSLQYSEVLTRVTSMFFSDTETSGFQITSKGYVLTEERGIFFTMMLSVFLCGILLLLSYIAHLRSASTKLDLPLNFVSVLLVIWVCATAYQVGLASYL